MESLASPYAIQRHHKKVSAACSNTCGCEVKFSTNMAHIEPLDRQAPNDIR